MLMWEAEGLHYKLGRNYSLSIISMIQCDTHCGPQYAEHLRNFQSLCKLSIVYMNISFLAIKGDIFGDKCTKCYSKMKMRILILKKFSLFLHPFWSLKIFFLSDYRFILSLNKGGERWFGADKHSKKNKLFCSHLVWNLWRYVKRCTDLLTKKANAPVGQKHHRWCHAECKIFIAILSFTESFSVQFHVLLHFKPVCTKYQRLDTIFEFKEHKFWAKASLNWR